MSANSSQIARRKPQARSRTTNGKVLFEGLDGRSAGARRLHDIIANLTAEIPSEPSEAERLEVRTVASLVLHAEQLTAALANGEPVDSEELTRVANGAARLLGAIRRRRQPVRRQTDLSAYLAGKSGAAA